MSNEIQQIIVYRNPLEAAVWNSMSDNPDVLLYLIIWAPLAILMTSIIFNMFQRFSTRSRHNSSAQFIMIFVGCVISAVLTYGIFNFSMI